VVLTSPEPTCGRELVEIVAECVAAGATAVQLRDKRAPARALAALATRLLEITRSAGALLIVNDRLDVALATGVDGVHLGPDDLPVDAARAIAPPLFLVGYSTDDPGDAAAAARMGADYLGVGAVYGTLSKPGLADEAIGPDRVGAVAAASGLPCVGIGGVTPDNAAAVFAVGAGVAVLGAVMGAPDPAAVVRRLASLAKRGPA
jgi:thiamine-phosphate pyrophosphorylase